MSIGEKFLDGQSEPENGWLGARRESIVREKWNTAAMESSREATDKAMMARCIALSRLAVSKGEYPFGAVIALDGQVVAEAINRTIRDGDVTRHAEVIALSHAQKAIGRESLRHCTVYTNTEPCAMCSYCIRETWVSRVVYALGSPVMGGLSKWNILRDDGLSDRMPQIFGAVPEVVSGVLLHEAQEAWRDWHPLAWELIKLRGLLTEPRAQGDHVHLQPAHRWSLWHYLQILFARTSASRIETDGSM
jgi:tRNA(adenine34) deaminase